MRDRRCNRSHSRVEQAETEPPRISRCLPPPGSPRDRLPARLRPPTAAWPPRERSRVQVKSAFGCSSPTVRPAAVTRTVGGASKYFKGDSPRSEIATACGGTTCSIDLPLVQRHCRPVAVSYPPHANLRRSHKSGRLPVGDRTDGSLWRASAASLARRARGSSDGRAGRFRPVGRWEDRRIGGNSGHPGPDRLSTTRPPRHRSKPTGRRAEPQRR